MIGPLLGFIASIVLVTTAKLSLVKERKQREQQIKIPPAVRSLDPSLN